jgi:hypothetical protein
MAAAILARVREGPLKNAGETRDRARLVHDDLLRARGRPQPGYESSSERAVFAPNAILLLALVVTTMVGSRRTG